MKRLLAVSAFLLLAILLWSSSGQQSAPGQTNGQSALQHEVTVVRKLVQVYVTDKRGNPITDLQRDDFIIYDNKDEKQITEFERHALTLPGTPVPSPAVERMETAIEPCVSSRENTRKNRLKIPMSSRVLLPSAFAA